MAIHVEFTLQCRALYLYDYKIDKVVEAGGVEPPSEKARNEENYVRIRLNRFS